MRKGYQMAETEENLFALLPDPLESFTGSQIAYLKLYLGSLWFDTGLPVLASVAWFATISSVRCRQRQPAFRRTWR